MSVLQSVIFIDGRNFRYNLRAFGFQPEDERIRASRAPYRLDEKHFSWKEFFQGVINKFDSATKQQHRLIRAYWYNAETIRPFEVSEHQIQQILIKYRQQYPDLSRGKIIELAREWWERERNYFEDAKHLFENIQRKIDFLEFKYTGEYVVALSHIQII